MRVQSNPGLEAELAADLVPITRKVAETGQRGAQRRARVDTGLMRRSITVTTLDNNGARVESEAPYSIYNEVGTSRKPAQPFMRPSMDDCRDAL